MQRIAAPAIVPGERLRAAHAAEPGGEDRPPARGRASRSASPPRRRTSGTCPGGCPACRCRSTSPAVIWPNIVSPSASSRRNSSHVAHFGTSSEFAISTRGAFSCVVKMPTGLPDCTSSVSSAPSSSSAPTIARSASWIARRLAGAAVHDELLRLLRDLGVEVVQQHPQRRLGRPLPRVQLRAARRADRARGRRTSASTRAASVSVALIAALRSPPRPPRRASRRGSQSRPLRCPPRASGRRAAAATARVPPRASRARRLRARAARGTPRACAPASSSIASARSQFASTCHAFSPAALPIDT